MPHHLTGKRVAFLATDMVEEVELTEPWKAVEQAGATPELASLAEGEIQGFDHYDKADTFPDVAVEEASAADDDALVLPGGVGNPDTLRTDEKAVHFVSEFFEQGKPVRRSATRPGRSKPGVVRGRRLTSCTTSPAATQAIYRPSARSCWRRSQRAYTPGSEPGAGALEGSMGKQMEGDNQERRKKAPEAREEGRPESCEAGVTSGASQQRAHLERRDDHEEKIEKIREGKHDVSQRSRPRYDRAAAAATSTGADAPPSRGS